MVRSPVSQNDVNRAQTQSNEQRDRKDAIRTAAEHLLDNDSRLQQVPEGFEGNLAFWRSIFARRITGLTFRDIAETQGDPAETAESHLENMLTSPTLTYASEMPIVIKAEAQTLMESDPRFSRRPERQAFLAHLGRGLFLKAMQGKVSGDPAALVKAEAEAFLAQ